MSRETGLYSKRYKPEGEGRDWTMHELIDELAGILEDEDSDGLSDEDAYARRFDLALLEALRDAAPTLDRLTRVGLEGMIEEVRAEQGIPEPLPGEPSEAEILRLRGLLERIAAGAEWVPYPGAKEHVINDLLVVGRVERFADKGATYGTVLDQRTGAIESDEKARALVIDELVDGVSEKRAKAHAAAEAAGVVLIADLQLHGPGSVYDSMGALGMRWTSSSPMEGEDFRTGRWLIRGVTNLPAKLPAWLKRKESTR